MTDNATEAAGRENDFLLVGIGASAGGITALRRFFERVQPQSRMSFVVILHLSPNHESNLAAVIQTSSAIPVTQVTESIMVVPDHVYVIPPNKYLIMNDGTIKLADPERGSAGHSPIDLFFRTLADNYGKDSVAVVLSGSGTDGVIGLRRIKEVGGFVIAEDPEEAEYDGMPRAAIGTAMVDFVLPVAEIPDKLRALHDGARRLQPIPEPEKEPSDSDIVALRDILAIVRVRTGHDFSQYKRPTLLRRISRRLQVHAVSTFAQYAEILRDNPEEISALLKDLLITVTNFFRDRDAFNLIEQRIIPELFEQKGGNDSVRLWSVGCATGEEAYSLGMLLREYSSRLTDPPRLQVFSTDIDEQALGEAREGLYPANITVDVTPERLRSFFLTQGDHYRIKNELREIILFAPHNVLRDPPFSKLDMISCRNLLIYLNREMQERLLGIFYFALRAGGILLLGASESADSNPAMFEPVDKKHRIFRRRQLAGSDQPNPGLISERWQVRAPHAIAADERVNPSLGQLHQDLVEQIGPPSILIDENYDILHVSTRAAKFVRFPAGEPTRNLLKVIVPELRLDLRGALLSAKAHGPQSRRLRIQVNGAPLSVNLTIRPAYPSDYLLVMFDEAAETPGIGTGPLQEPGAASHFEVIQELETELQRTKDELRSTIEQYETSNEELKASNEELQAINEELRSATEELETSKEELQSVNEELTTLNQEYREKIEEVGRSNSDLNNLMASTDIATIFLDRGLKIKLYTPRAQQLFNITPIDIGRPLEHFTNKLDYRELARDAEEVLSTLQSREREVPAADQSGYLARLSPYRTLEDHIDGVVITFVDITTRRKIDEELKQRALQMKEQAEILDLAHVLIRDEDDRIVLWNTGNARLYGHTKEEALGKKIDQLLKTVYPAPLAEIKQQLETTGEWEGELQHTTKSGARIVVASHWVLHRQDEHTRPVILEVNNDVTARRLAEQALRESDLRKDEFLATLAHELRNPLSAIMNSVEVLKHPDSGSSAIDRAKRTLDRQTRHLVRMVDDLLDVERLNRGRISLELTRIDLESAIEAAVQMTGPAIERRGHTVNLSTPDQAIYVNGDLERLTQIIANLLDNSGKYTPRGGAIDLSLQRDGSFVDIVIRDNGIGIAPEVMPRLFQLMSTPTEMHANSEYTGLGVGLALVRQLTELHGGSVSAHSAGAGKGSTFTVRLPMLEALPIDKPSAQPAAEAPKIEVHKRILIVDDNRDSADAMATLLQIDGHEVETAYGGFEALEKMPVFQAEIVFLDLGMPRIDGYAVARQMRERHPGIVLVALSGWDRETDRQRAREAGFDYHIRKPASAEEIARVIQEQS